MQSPSAVLPPPSQLATSSITSFMYSSIWQATSPEAHITVHASSFIFQITFRPRYDRIGCCGCSLLREGVTCLRGAKISMRNHETWIHFFLKSEYFGIFMDYLLLHTGFLVPISRPWPYSKSCSRLLLAAEHVSAQGQETCTSWKNILWAYNGCSTPTALLTTYEKWRSCVCTYGKILSTPHALLWRQKLTCRV